MKKLIFTLTLLANTVFANTEDSLIANVGKKAKVVFYAEKKEDFNEIGKYDLNLLFKELRKRADKDFKFNDEVTLKEADENLKNREANSTLTQRKWWNKVNLNVFVGVTQSISDGTQIQGKINEFTHPVYGKVTASDYYWLFGKPSFLLGLGGFYEDKIYERKKMNIAFRYGGGIDFVGNKLRTKAGYTLSFSNGGASSPTFQTSRGISLPAFQIFLDSLKSVNILRNDESPYIQYLSPNMYLQLTPTINFKNKKGQNTFNFGVGVKTSLNLAGIGQNKFYNSYRAEYNNSNTFYYRNKTFQTSWIINVGYKYINAFVQVYPDVARTTFIPEKNRNSFFIPNAGRINTYIAGLRFGK
jgi:hypothetical protein